jgi:hypothetical protein
MRNDSLVASSRTRKGDGVNVARRVRTVVASAACALAITGGAAVSSAQAATVSQTDAGSQAAVGRTVTQSRPLGSEMAQASTRLALYFDHGRLPQQNVPCNAGTVPIDTQYGRVTAVANYCGVRARLHDVIGNPGRFVDIAPHTTAIIERPYLLVTVPGLSHR